MSNRKESWAKMYQVVIKDKRIRDSDFRVLAFIKSFAPKWRVNQEFIAKELQIGISTVGRCINVLDAAG